MVHNLLKNKVIPFIVVIIIILLCSIAFASNQEISVYVNDTKVEFDVSPMIVNGRTLVPLRKICEAMGTNVQWDEETQSVIISNENNKVTLIIGNPIAVIDNEVLNLDVPPRIVNGRTLVPLRFIAESLDSIIEWNSETWKLTLFQLN